MAIYTKTYYNWFLSLFQNKLLFILLCSSEALKLHLCLVLEESWG